MLSLVRSFAVKLRPPRVLHCEFPLGRPLGRPRDPAFQRTVIDAAFALLARPEGPVLEDFPEHIEDDAVTPLSCPLPPAAGSGRPEAVEEALAYRRAYDRQRARNGRTLLGRAIGPDDVPGAVERFLAVADGRPWREAGFPGTLTDVAMDVRAYYEEAAIELAGVLPQARSADSWFFQKTVAGKLLLAVQSRLRDQGEGIDTWLGIAPRGYVRTGSQSPGRP